MKHTIALLGLLLARLGSAAQPEYVQEFEKIARHRHEAMAAASETLLRQYKTELEPLVRRATEANDLDAAVRIRTEFEAATHKLECLGRWNLENLSDGHKGVIELNADGTFSSGLARIGVWDVEGGAILLLHANRGGHHDLLKLPVRDGKLAGHNSMGHQIRLHRQADSSPSKVRDIVIKSAIFGSGAKAADVTTRVAELLITEPQGFAVSADSLRVDPLPYQTKALAITYEYGGKQHLFVVPSLGKVSRDLLLKNARDERHELPSRSPADATNQPQG